jgi:hypothetical protein
MKCTMKKHSSALLFLILMATGLHGQDNFSGIFHATDAEYRYAEGVTFEQLLRQKQEYDTSGFLLKEVETFGQTKNRRFWAAWEKTPGESRIEEISDWDSMVWKKREMAQEGYCMQDIETYFDDKGAQRFLAVWHKSPVPHKMWKLDSREGLEQVTKDMARSNHFPVDVEAFAGADGKTGFLAVYHQRKPAQKSHMFVTGDLKKFNVERVQRRKSGFRMTDFEYIKEQNGDELYLAVFHKGDYEESLRHHLNGESFSRLRNELAASRNLKLIDIEIAEGSGNAEMPEDVQN